MINVNFRVVGMYLGSNKANADRSVVVEVEDNPSVFDVMKAVAKKYANGNDAKIDFFSFTPTNPSPGEDIVTIFVNYKEAPIEGRAPGLYVLSDSSSTNPITTFQYYIFDQDFVQKNNNNSFIPFSEKPEPESEIKNGYSVIIRQVSILTGPNNARLLASRASRASDILSA